MTRKNNVVVGCDIGGAHFKIARAENGRIVEARTLAAQLWLGLDQLAKAVEETASLFAGSRLNAFTMTGELSDIFPSREAGIAGLLEQIGRHFPGQPAIYAGRSGFVRTDQAAGLGLDVASANWHASAALVARTLGDALFVDMGSTTTDIIVVRNHEVANQGYTDAERLDTGELVYTGFVRSALHGIVPTAPIRGRPTPLMNEYFASIADVHRILGVLDENDDKQPSADRQAKTTEGSMARMARMVGRDAADLSTSEWRDLAAWFSEQQLRLIHDGTFQAVGTHRIASDAPVVGAGIGRWQISRLATRMERRYVDFADIIPADEAARKEAGSAAPATAVALLASDLG